MRRLAGIQLALTRSGGNRGSFIALGQAIKAGALSLARRAWSFTQPRPRLLALLIRRSARCWVLAAAHAVCAKLREAAIAHAPALTRVASWWRGPRETLSSRAQTASIVGVTSAFAGALAAMFLWMSLHSRQTVIADTFASSSNLALSVEQFVARTMETVDLSLRLIGADVEEDGVTPSRGINKLMARRIRQSPQIVGLMLISPEGRVQFSAGNVMKASFDASRASYFIAARHGAGMQVVLEDHPTVSRGVRHLIFASRRINRADGRFTGVVAAVLSTDYLQRFLSTLHVGTHGIIGLHTTDGTMLVRQPISDGYVGRNFGAMPLFAEWLPWASSGVFPLEFKSDGLRRVVGYQRVQNLPLVVYVALSEDEALAAWRRSTFFQAAAGTVILALAVLTAFLLHRQLRARMRAHVQLSDTVHELQKARLAAEEASRVKSQFLANMSHELRTPLNAIIGFSDIIGNALVGPVAPRYRDYARDIHGCGQHLLALVNDVLDLSRIEVGRLELHEERVDLTKVVGDCHRLVAERFREGRIELIVELAPDLPALFGDELRLKQIVLNLLSNAGKFTPAGGRVALTVAVTADGAIQISVSDSGVGMKPEDIPAALEPFRQLDGALNRRYEGAGLGLPLARTLTELHGGFLSITTALGKGTTVTVTLPASRVLARSSPVLPAEPPAKPITGRKLRLVAAQGKRL